MTGANEEKIITGATTSWQRDMELKNNESALATIVLQHVSGQNYTSTWDTNPGIYTDSL